VDIMKLQQDKQWGGLHEITRANESLTGKMVAVEIVHDRAPFFKETPYYESFLTRDNINKAVLDYLAGKSTQIPNREKYDYAGIFSPEIFIPESQLPPQ